MEAATTVQAWIEAREAADLIEYGIRSIKVCRGAYYCTGIHAAQLTRACQAARQVTGEFIAIDAGTLRTLRAAKKVAVERVREADAERKALGNARQIRLALAA